MNKGTLFVASLLGLVSVCGGGARGGVPRGTRADEVRLLPAEAEATERIQAALDRVGRAGGGRISLAPGSYAVGGLRLRSNTELHLEAGAVLDASRDCAAFAILERDRLEPVPETLRLLSGYRGAAATRLAPWCNGILRIFCATNVAVTGEPGSAIDGHNSYCATGEEHYRGVHGICADFSTNVVVRGVELRNTGNWATRFFDCADLCFEDLRIRGGHDGVHVRGCDRIRVARCDIRTGDDAIAGFDNTDVTVADCALNSSCSAFRFGGTHVRVSRCRVWGPGEWPWRGSLSAADKKAGMSSQGRGRANLLSFWTYFADFSRPVRNPPGDIIVSDCTVANADRFLHYNFSGNEPWQKGAPLGDIRFEQVRATGLGASLCAYGDAARPLTLTLVGCDLAFRAPQAEFVRAAHVSAVKLKGVRVERVEGPCARIWTDAPALKFSDVKGLAPTAKKADKPFFTRPI